MTRITEQLQTLSIYAPSPVATLAFQDPQGQPGGAWRRFYAATAFADISGFTPLAEELASSGVRGAEELTTILNRVFEALITTAESYGGQVVKFGGDALSLIWPCEPETQTEAVWRSVMAAFAMQAAMAAFTTVQTSQGNFGLQMKIGLSVGELLEVHAGGVFARWEYVLAGAPMANMSSAENQAEAGEIVLDERAWQLVGGQLIDNKVNFVALKNRASNGYVFGEQVIPGYYRLTHVWGGVSAKAFVSPDWARLEQKLAAKVAATLRSYIPGAISSLLESGHHDMLAELKPMTVCFIGFGGLDYDNDPEAGPRLSNFMRDAQEIIYYYEGSVNKLAVGDKGSVLLILFGAPPFFHEDDEVRAVACMLGVCKVAARHNLKARIGLAAGSVFAGPLGAPQRREYTVIGDTVNLAARLMQKAGEGEVWLDQSVYHSASRYFEHDDLGEIHVKGKSEPRHVYRALREKEQDQQEQAARYLLTELTGRDKELTIIDQLAEKVWAGHGQVLLLSGEAGVGKSRLATEIIRRWLEELGGVPHSGDCLSYGRHTPYLPWRGVLSSIAGLSTRLSVEQRVSRLANVVSRLTPPASASLSQNYWQERLPLLADILGLECPETDLTRGLSENLRRDNLFATIRAIAVEEAARRPSLILLEDTHWSDELSLELAVHLAKDIANYPIFLVLVHRPLGSPAPAPYQQLQALPYATQLEVNELDPEASLKLVQNKLGVKTLPETLADLIRGKGQGNPFFIEEIVNSLLSLNVIKIENGDCRVVGDLANLEMPDTVQKVVLARIDRLPEEEKMTLKVAAAIGRTFQRDLLETVHPWIETEATLEEHLLHLQAEDFTRKDATENQLDFLFKHVITQEVAYETMLYSQRQQLHATIGAALENRYSSNDAEVIDLLAYHYSRSNDHQKALHYLQRAAHKALNGYANEAAISYFSEALSFAKELDDVNVQFDLLAGRERGYDHLGNRLAQAEDLTQMKQLALAQDSLIRQLETGNRRLQLDTNLGQYHDAMDIAAEMLALARRANEPIWEARTLSSMGVTAWRQGDYNRARDCMLQALDRQEAATDRHLKATCLNYLGLIHSQISEYEQARADYLHALDIYRASDDKGGEASCANNLGLLESHLGRYAQAEQYYSQALSICHTIGNRLLEGISLNLLGQVQTILGAYPPAKEQLEQSLSIRQAIGDRRGQAFCLHDLGALYLANGQTAEAVKHFHAAAKLRRELGETGNYVASLAAKGEACLVNNDLVAAHQSLTEALNHLEQGSGSGEYPTQYVWWAYAQVCLARSQESEAQQALRKASQLVKAKADQIRNLEFRQSYLENVRVNAAIVAAMVKVEMRI
jgi:predicted ATPase/class 3 adenylate cyclase